ncbi:phosphatase [Gammaproteobacteria bacterium]|jgi:exopolyphosphatase/guanosine-5'-triphosphate,3'-diphosphate pyrophosphatase|nr:phosphatase [Gammaproteobacteria bacterium]|tara:strand:+ start:991 stop:1851 length:861 start_codon:yes stop_codon:yes gene_type:complete
MKIASIDIGTNAVKSKIFKTTPTSIEFIEGIRSPIRLGTDVFNNGCLAKEKLDLLVKTLKKYQKNFIKNDIAMYEIVATSAFRDTKNSEEARRYVENKIEHPIRIISGLEEAKLIRLHPKAQSKSSKVYVDVGGGSTEIYIFENNQHIIQSFQLGAVRGMLAKDDPQEWLRLKKWLKKQPKINTLVGLGGNIRSFLNLNNKKKMNSQNFIDLTLNIKKLDVDSKMSKYGLQKDRADVIDFALIIYAEIIKLLEVKEIKSTKWGVSDSIAVKTFHELYSKKISISRN